MRDLIMLPTADDATRETPIGRRIKSAFDCYYPPAIETADLLLVDFDRTNVGAGGLFLVEIFNGKNVE